MNDELSVRQRLDNFIRLWTQNKINEMYEFIDTETITREAYTERMQKDCKYAYPEKIIKAYQPDFGYGKGTRAITVYYVKCKKNELKNDQETNWIVFFLKKDKLNGDWKIQRHFIYWEHSVFLSKNLVNKFDECLKVYELTKKFISYLQNNDLKNIYLSYSQPNPKIMDYEEWNNSSDRQCLSDITAGAFSGFFSFFPLYSEDNSTFFNKVCFDNLKVVNLKFTKGLSGVFGIHSLSSEEIQSMNFQKKQDLLCEFQNEVLELLKLGDIYKLLGCIIKEYKKNIRFNSVLFDLIYLFKNNTINTYKLISISGPFLNSENTGISLLRCRTQGLGEILKIYAVMVLYKINEDNEWRINGVDIEEIS